RRRATDPSRDPRKRGRVGEAVEEDQQKRHAHPIVFLDRKQNRAEEVEREQGFAKQRPISAGAVLLAQPLSAGAFDSIFGGAPKVSRASEEASQNRMNVVDRQSDAE